MTNPVFPILTMSQGQDSAQYSVETEDPSTKSPLEGGYVSSRAKHTRTPRKTFTSGFTMLKNADRAILDTFYGTTVKGGSVIFDWTDPASTVVYQVRFTDKLKYKYTGIGASQRWDVAFTLEQA